MSIIKFNNNLIPKEKQGQINPGFSQHDEGLYGQEYNRPVMSAKYLEENYDYNEINSQNVVRSAAKYVKKYYKPSKDCFTTFMMKRIPFINWIVNYDIKNALVNDLVGGLTVGVIQVPQAMAYSQMAGLPPANGLYVTFFHCLIYFFLGTSRHLSPGTYAVISLMVLTATNKYEGKLFPLESESFNQTNQNSTLLKSEYISNDPVVGRVLISTALSLSSGIFMLFMGIFHFGFVTKFLSDAIVAGLTVGAVFQVIISQVKVLLGVKLDPFKHPFVFIGTCIEIFKQIDKTNIAVLVISIISLVILMGFKIINDKYSHKFPAPIPIEITAVIIATLISYFADFKGKWKVPIVGTLPLGFPTPTVPPMNLFILLIGDSISIAILTFALQISFAKLFAKKHNYLISANQEFFAYGTSNVVSSFFNGYPGCVALSRCIIADGIGVKTQIVGGITALIMLVIIMALGPYLATLPNCVLAALIVVALAKKALDVTDFWYLFKKNKLDGLAWLITFVGCVLFDVDIGLYTGLVSTLLLIVFKSQRARSTVLGNIPGTNIFECVNTCREAREYKHVKIIRYEESVYYANVDNFKYKVIKLSGVNPKEILYEIEQDCRPEFKHLEKIAAKQKKLLKKDQPTDSLDFADYVFDKNGFISVDDCKQNIKKRITERHLDNVELKNLILDASCINYVDAQGIQAIMWLYEQYKLIHVSIYLSYPKLAVRHLFKKFDLKYDTACIFQTTFEAVLHIFRKDYPDKEIILGDNNKVEESDPEDDTNHVGHFKAYNKNDKESFTVKF